MSFRRIRFFAFVMAAALLFCYAAAGAEDNIQVNEPDRTNSTEEQSSENDNSEIGRPVGSKTLVSNEDGTYTLTLSVKGQSSLSHEESYKKSNILFVMDRSSSMITRTVNDEQTFWYYGIYNTDETTFRGDINPNKGYQFYGVINGDYVQLTCNQSWLNGNWGNYNLTYRNGNTNVPYPQNAPLYVQSKTTRLYAEQNALNNLFSQLMAKNDPSGINSDIVETAIISFGEDRFDKRNWAGETEEGWTSGTDISGLSAAVNSNRFTSGTNWEDALQYANEVITDKKTADGDEEDYYVVFLTDGEPTAVAGEHNGALHTGSGSNGNIYAYDHAKDEAKDLVVAGIKFYNIFTYKKDEDVTYSIYLTNYAYGNLDYNSSTGTKAVQDYFSDAQSPNDVVNALQNIFFAVEDSIGHGNVSITDTMTTDAMTTTVVHGQSNGYVYTVKDPGGNTLYTATATGSLNNPTVTFNVPGSCVPSYTANKTTIGGKNVYSVRTAEGNEYKIALADVNNATGELVWDLSPVGLLLDDCTYSVSFIVWPDQDAYDYVAGLNNGLEGYTWDASAATHGLGYDKGGVSRFPSIVKYDDGTFAVLTNTEQKIHYSIIETKTVNGEQGEPEITGPFYTDLPTPAPMPLTASTSKIQKVWNVGRDPGILAALLYNPDGTPTETEFNFDVFQGGGETPYTTVTLGWDGQKYDWSGEHVIYVKYVENKFVECNKNDAGALPIGTHWAKEFSIATGLMLSQTRMDALGLDTNAYPHGDYNGTTYYVLDPGHDYTIREKSGEDIGYEFDFDAPIYHPMLVNGTLKSVNYTPISDKTIKITSIDESQTGLDALTVENTLRGYIILHKRVEDLNHVQIEEDQTEFTYDITLTNQDGPFVGTHIPWYGINSLFYHDEALNYYQAEGTIIYTETGGPYTFSGAFDPDSLGWQTISYTDDEGFKTVTIMGNQMTASDDGKTASATFKINQSQSLSIANVPVGTEYSITERPMTGYTLTSVTGIKETIIPNTDNNITFTNTVDLHVPVPGTKVLRGRELKESEFQFQIEPAEGALAAGVHYPGLDENNKWKAFNHADGTFTFDLYYSMADYKNNLEEGKDSVTFTYKVTEVIPDTVEENSSFDPTTQILYDQQAFYVQVTLRSDGNNSLTYDPLQISPANPLQPAINSVPQQV